MARSRYIQGEYSEALEYFKKVEDPKLNAEKHNERPEYPIYPY
jgi:hypothetical protein